MTLYQAIKEAIFMEHNNEGLLEPVFPKSAYSCVWRFDTEPELRFYLATGDRHPDSELPTRYLEIWTPSNGFDLYEGYKDHKDQLLKTDWRFDVLDKGVYTTVQMLVITANVVDLYKQHRAMPTYLEKVKCYYSKR